MFIPLEKAGGWTPSFAIYACDNRSKGANCQPLKYCGGCRHPHHWLKRNTLGIHLPHLPFARTLHPGHASLFQTSRIFSVGDLPIDGCPLLLYYPKDTDHTNRPISDIVHFQRRRSSNLWVSPISRPRLSSPSLTIFPFGILPANLGKPTCSLANHPEEQEHPSIDCRNY